MTKKSKYVRKVYGSFCMTVILDDSTDFDLLKLEYERCKQDRTKALENSMKPIEGNSNE